MWGCALSDVRVGVEREWAAHRAQLLAVLEQLKGLDRDAPEFDAAFGRLEVAGAELLRFEGTIPARLAEPARQVTARLVTWAAWTHAGAAALLVAAMALGWMSTSWSLATVLMLVLAAAFGSQTISAADHQRRRGACWLVFAAAPLPPAAGLWTGWLMVAWLLAWALAFFVVHFEKLVTATDGVGTR